MVKSKFSQFNGDSSLSEVVLFFLQSLGLEKAITDLVKSAINDSRIKESPEAHEDSPYLTRFEVCQLAHITETTLWRLEKAGSIRKIKLGRKNLYSRHDVEELLGSGGFHIPPKSEKKTQKSLK